MKNKAERILKRAVLVELAVFLLLIKAVIDVDIQEKRKERAQGATLVTLLQELPEGSINVTGIQSDGRVVFNFLGKECSAVIQSDFTADDFGITSPKDFLPKIDTRSVREIKREKGKEKAENTGVKPVHSESTNGNAGAKPIQSEAKTTVRVIKTANAHTNASVNIADR